MRTSAFMSWAVALGTALSFTLAVPSFAADADGAAPTADKLIATAKSRLWICSLYARVALVHLDAKRESEAQSALEEVLSKIRESKESFSETYVAIKSKLDGRNTEATNALNDYASSVLVAYDGAAIRTGETQATYNRRAADLESEVSTKADVFMRRLHQAKGQTSSPVPPPVPSQASAEPPSQASAQPPAQPAATPSPKASE